MKAFFKSRPAALAAVLMFLALTPFMVMRDFTPANELRYLSIVDEAMEDGHVFTFSNQGEPYADKPPLYFWLMMLLKTVFGHHCMYALSMLSFIPAMVIMLVMDRWLVLASGGGSRVSFSERFAASMMLGTSALFAGMSVFLRMDMLMCMFIVLSLFTFYKSYTGVGNRRLQSWLIPLYIFLALFTKGPVGLLVPPVAILVFLALDGRLKDAGRYIGWKTWGVVAALCAVWFTGVWTEGGRPYLENLLFHQTVDRAVDAFHHKEPFWYYLMVIWYVAAPYSLMLVPVFIVSLFRKGSVSSSCEIGARRLFIAAVTGTFVMLSAFSSKLAVYLLPVFPFLVYFFPLYIRDRKWNGLLAASLLVPAAIFAAAGIGGVAVLALRCIPAIETYPFVWSPAVYTALLVLAAGGILSAFYVFRSRSWRLPVICISASMLLCVLLASTVMPQANDYIGYRNMCREAADMACGTGDADRTDYVALFVYRPESMDAYLHKDIVDYGKDIQAYLDSEAGPHVLMVKTSEVRRNGELYHRLEGMETRRCGEYSLFLVTGR